MKILFVGDEPSKTNTSKDVAFIGAKCHKRLLQWIDYLELDNDSYYLLNSNAEELLEKIEKLYNKGYKVIALGLKASNRLNKRQILHFPMQHPSGLNRKLNNKEFEQSQLKELKIYINS